MNSLVEVLEFMWLHEIILEKFWTGFSRRYLVSLEEHGMATSLNEQRAWDGYLYVG